VGNGGSCRRFEVGEWEARSFFRRQRQEPGLDEGVEAEGGWSRGGGGLEQGEEGEEGQEAEEAGLRRGTFFFSVFSFHGCI
jgi:hypothetical protein